MCKEYPEEDTRRDVRWVPGRMGEEAGEDLNHSSTKPWIPMTRKMNLH